MFATDKNKHIISHPLKTISALVLLIASALFIIGCGEKNKPVESSVNNNRLHKYFYKRFEGRVEGKGDLTMNLSGKDSVLTGDIYFKNSGVPEFFTFNSKIHANNSVRISLHARNSNIMHNDNSREELSGKFISNNKIEGEFINYNTGSKNKFKLKENYSAGSYKFRMENASRTYGSRESGGAGIEYIFPQFEDKVSGTLSMINNKILKNITGSYGEIGTGKNLKNIESEMNDFIDRFMKFEKDPLFPSNYKPFWEDSFYSSVVFNSRNVLVLENIDFRYEGGAHPNTFYTFYNFNTLTGKEISLSDLFANGYKPKLDNIGEKKFRENYHIGKNESLEKRGYFLKNHKFHLNNNFAIFASGLLFKFNPYEIAAYVYGAPEVFILYKDLNGLLKKKSVLSELINRK